MYYFNALYFKRWQNIFILIVWIIGAVLVLLGSFQIVTLSRTLHTCSLFVSLTVPVFIFSIEMKIRQFQYNEAFDKKRTVIFTDDGIEYYIESRKKGEFDSWNDIKYLCETKSLFIVYKDEKHCVPILKTNIEKDVMEEMRLALKNKLETRYNHSWLL
jgi:Na+(H+)/acetate symporter ActP